MKLPSTMEYDVAIVGGGPGGSTAAALARQRGWRVLVVEKEFFPRFRIGESLLPMGNRLLQESGVWEKVEAGGFFPKYGATFHSADGQATQAVDFRNSLVPGLDRTFQVERARFDQLLLDHAAEAGAEVRMGTRAESVAPALGGLRLNLVGPSGATSATARWVFDAGGRLNAMGTTLPRRMDPSPFPKRVAIFNHFEGALRAEGRPAGDTVVVRLNDGWFWLIPLDERRTSVGLVLPATALRSAEAGSGSLPRLSGIPEDSSRSACKRSATRSPEEIFYSAVRASAKLTELCGQARPLMPFQVTSDYTAFHAELASDRLVRIGDAAGFFDPIFSSGVYISLASAKAAVELVAAADEAGRPLALAEQHRYTRHIKRQARTFQKLIAAFYDNASFEVFMVPEIPFDLRSGITAIVAGHSQLIWPLWWRFHAFLFACALQRRLRWQLGVKLNLASSALTA